MADDSSLADDSPQGSIFAFPSLNEAPHQLDVLEHEGRALLALGTGRYVAIACGELCEVVQLLGPHGHDIGCADWSRDGAACLAVGSGRDVSFYHREPRTGAERWAPGGKVTHEEPVHALRWAGPALWTAAGHRLGLLSWVDGGWVVSWSCSISQPAKLLASSGDGTLLATAGEFDRLVKVWRRAQARPLPHRKTPASTHAAWSSEHALARRTGASASATSATLEGCSLWSGGRLQWKRCAPGTALPGTCLDGDALRRR